MSQRFETKCAWFGCTETETTPIYCTPDNRVYDFCAGHQAQALERNTEMDAGDLPDPRS